MPNDSNSVVECFSGKNKHLGLRPLLISGVIRDLLKTLFANPANIESPFLREKTWSDDPRTGILLEVISRKTMHIQEKRPAVIIKRNAYRNIRFHVQDRVGDDKWLQANYQTLWAGSHTLFCASAAAGATELLATDVQRFLTGYGPVVAKEFSFHKFQVTQVGAISELEEAKEHFVVPVTVGWAYLESWAMVREDRPFAGAKFEFDLDFEN